MRIFKKLSLLFVGIFLICYFTGFNVYANDVQDTLTLHEKTKIYNKINDDWFEGCNDYTDYQYQDPAITVLTHGYGGNASHWSSNESGVFAYQEESLITKMAKKNDIDIYWAICKSQTSFVLVKCNEWEEGTKLTESEESSESSDNKHSKVVERINDISKHIVLVFQSGAPESKNDYVYGEFHNVLDTISYQYKTLAGKLPRFNLVGHSRGGITNIMYATEHPYNVESIFSMGTPYNSTTLGQLDFLLNMVYPNTTEGIEELRDREESKKIRDRWNEVYELGIPCKVTAFGTAVDFDYINKFFEEIEGDSNYSSKIAGYKEIIEKVLEFAKSHPHLSGIAVGGLEGASSSKIMASILTDIVTGIVNIPVYFEGFFTDSMKKTYHEFMKSFDSTTDFIVDNSKELNDIFELCVLVDDKLILLDDLFIDVNSQLGYFADGEDYKGFERILKVFGIDDYSEFRSVRSLPGVAHNMEALNDYYTWYISSSLIYGHSVTPVTSIKELDSFTGFVDEEKMIEFIPFAGGVKEISVNCDYSVCDEFGNQLEKNEDKVYLNEGEKYFIILKTQKRSFVELTIDVAQNFRGTYSFDEDSKQLMYITGLSKGYHILTSSNDNSRYYDMNGNQVNSFFYSEGESSKYYLFVESSGENVIFDITSPKIINPNNEFYEFNKDILLLKNEYNTILNFEIVFQNGTEIELYDSNNSFISSSTIVENNIYTYTVSLESNQIVYILVEKSGSIKTKLADNQLFWFDGKDMINTDKPYEVETGKSYSIELKLKTGETFRYLPFSYVLSNNLNGVYINNYKVEVKNNASVGSTTSIHHKDFNAQVLELKVIPSRNLSLEYINSEDMILQWSLNDNLNNQIKSITYILNNGSESKTITANSLRCIIENGDEKNKKFNTLHGTLDISISSIQFENGNFDSKYFDFNPITIDSLYAGGNGSGSNPYRITCRRHFENIQYNRWNSFKLMNDLNLGSWTPIVMDFYGTFHGNEKTITLESLTENSENKIGLFAYNSGRICFLTVKSARISTTNTDVCGGIIAAYNSGTINDCKVVDASISFKTTGVIYEKDYQNYSTIGGVAGFNNDTIIRCKVEDVRMSVSGTAGGVAGVNLGQIEDCHVKGYIEYYNKRGVSGEESKKYNGRVGGVAGYNMKRIYHGTYEGEFVWVSSNDDKNNYPSLGKIVGANAKEGKLEYCSSKVDPRLQYSSSSWWFNIYDQSFHCFKVQDGLIGYQE